MYEIFLDWKKRWQKDETTIENIRNRFRLKNEIDENTVKDINLFRLKKENKAIKDRIIRDIWNIFSMKKNIVINQ